MVKNLYTFTTLAEFPHLYSEVIALIEKEFHYEDEFHFENDFKPLVHPDNFENCFIAIHNESKRAIAHVGIVSRIMIKNNFQLPIAMIGGIVTHPDHRGKNIFSILMRQAITKHENNVGLFFLWSDLKNIYEKFGFNLAGGIIETGKGIPTLDELPMGFTKTNFKKITIKQFEQIKKIYAGFNLKYFFTLVRSNADWEKIRDMSSIELFIQVDSAGEIKNYFCMGKGRDLKNIIHEIGSINKNSYDSLVLHLSKYRVWLPETEKRLFLNKEILYTAFTKIASINILDTFLREVSSNQLKINTIVDNDIVNFEFAGKKYNASLQDFTHYLIGPTPIEEFKSLELSPYISGTDSV